MSAKKLRKELSDIATANGFELVRTTNHLIWRHACGAQVVTPKTPSDHRSIKNSRKEFPRALAAHMAAFA